MELENIQNILKVLYADLNIDQKDEEYKRYLEEKIIKAYNYAKKHNLSDEEFTIQVNQILPDFINQYKRFKSNVSFTSNIPSLNFGISINFQLIDLFKIAEKCTNNEEFIKLRDEYFLKLGTDPRFQGFDYIFPGLKEITYEEITNIYHNVISNVDCITPEWVGKMRCIIDITKPLCVNNAINMEIFNFELLDKVANFARKNGMKLRMHNIIWHKDFRQFLENASKEQIYEFLDVYMNELSKRYSDVFYSIDVLNEIASDEPGQILRDSKWREKLGDDYYIEILRIAKKNFSNIDLFYNEYGEERPEKRKNILAIIDRIKKVEEQEGITLLDGIGIQSHYSTQTPDDEIKQTYLGYARIGKKIQITEFDVTNDGKESSFDYQTNRVYRTVLDCATSCGAELFNLWGVSSNVSWKSKAVNNFLNQNGNPTFYSKKILETYSRKRKKYNQMHATNSNNNTIELT